MSTALAGIAAGAIVASSSTPLFPVALALGLPYLVIYVAFAGTGHESAVRVPDISYGLYIYGFPIQQLAVFGFGDRLGFVGLVVVSLGAAIVVGTLSWYLVEKPALGLKQRWGRRVGGALAVPVDR